MMVSVEAREKWVARYKLKGRSYYQDSRDWACDNRESKNFLSQKECDTWISLNKDKCENLEIIHTKEIK